MEQAQSQQSIAQINADALAQQVPIQANLKDLQGQRRRLTEDIQRQQAQIDLLAVELETQTTQTTDQTAAVDQEVLAKQVASGDPSLIPLVAPFEGVIYATNHDAGEQVNRPAALLSLLDCNELWVETLVSTDQARRIDASQPVRIQQGDAETNVGNVAPNTH